MSEVCRFTTKYVPAEDRIQLLLELKSGEVQVLWFTRRLLNMIVPRLLQLLEQTPVVRQAIATTPSPKKAEVVQRFSQQAAFGSIQKQPSVRPSGATPQRQIAVLVTEVDIHTGKTGLTLEFKGGNQDLQSIPFGEQALRQWLGVVYLQYRAGHWQEPFWPSWMDPTSDIESARHLN